MKKFIIIMIVWAAAVSGSYAMDTLIKNPLIGKSAPDFTLQTLEGRMNFAQFRDGKRAIVFFWATWCPHCREALADLGRRKEEFRQKNIPLILIDVGEKETDVRSYLARNGIDLNVFLDERSDVAGAYKVIGVPAFFFISPSGVIQDMQFTLPDNYEEILKEEQP